jgi:tetratricopeptide (TPR) repeat protein
MDEHHETDDLDQRLAELEEAFDDFDGRCLFRSSYRTAGEIYRAAKSGGRIVPYLNAGFKLMNGAQSLLEPEKGREAAIEVIALLESEDLARRIQPDFPEEEYYQTVAWMSACGYDNLAKHTAIMQGYNSEGMHGCIADGIQVCRRTGKLRCITCFREYAFDVYLAADDLDMAMHFARLTATMPEEAPGAERRWVAAKNLCRAYTILGRVEEAEEAAHRALALSESYFRPMDAKLDSQVLLENALLMAGKHEELARHIGAPSAAREIPEGESVAHDLGWALRDALAACCSGNYDEAIKVLTQWDRQLSSQKCLDEWFETRLRLIAAQRLAGNQQAMEGLARQLDSKARTANDWLTLRRLSRLLDPSEPPAPWAPAASPSAGPFAAWAAAAPGDSTERVLAAESTAPVDAVPSQVATEEEPPPATPLDEPIDRLANRLDSLGEDEAAAESFRRDLLAIDPGAAGHPFDAIRLLHLARFAIADPAANRQLWAWAEQISQLHPEEASVLNLQAVLGDMIRDSAPSEEEGAFIEPQRIDLLFRQSLRLDPENPGNFGRAGAYSLDLDDLGEAERRLARGFRLARGSSFLALRLADVYRRTDRPRDALAVLDMCLREGTDDPGVAWDAMMTCLNLEQFDSLVTYADRFEEMQPGQPWTQYYRANALLELGELDKAREALDDEERRVAESLEGASVPLPADKILHVTILRSCVAAAEEKEENFRTLLRSILQTPLRTVDSLTFSGLCRLFEKLWAASHILPEEDDLRLRLNDRLLAAGLAPDDFFEPSREENEVCEGVNFYRCTVLQPLDAHWPQFAGCLAGQESWRAYHAEWGVLARNEDEAAEFLLPWQARCYRLPPEIENIEMADEGYRDRPGIVWQGFRWGEEGEEGAE